MKKLSSLFFFFIYSLSIFSCQKIDTEASQKVQKTSVLSSGELQSFSNKLSRSTEFRLFVQNLKILKILAFSSAYPKSYLFVKEPNTSTFMKKIYQININDTSKIKVLLNSQFSKGDSIYSTLIRNMALRQKIVQNFPEIFKELDKNQDAVITNAITKVLSLQNNNVANLRPVDGCVQSCENQYYISAGACAFFVETVGGAVVCFVAACAGLSACKSGC